MHIFVDVECGGNEKALQMRCTIEMDTSDDFAIEPVHQCVASTGIASSVLVATSAIFSSPILRGAPHRGSSSSPAKRFWANRFRYSPAVSKEMLNSSSIAQLFSPSAVNSTIWARTASARAIFRRRPGISNSLRSLSLSTIFTTAPRVIATSEAMRQRERITMQDLQLEISETGH